jgi:hypothetical protein
MFSSKNAHYILIAGLVIVASYVGMYSKQAFSATNNEYDMIKKYLLNDSPLYGFNKTKLWIHSKYEYNARHWESFQSRSSRDLNQPYLHLTIKTIIDHCGDDFNICLIDDETFSKLIPGWDIDVANIAEPAKSHYREIGMMELVYYYGGMVVPNSFLCLKNLKPMFLEGVAGNKPFVCEQINRSTNLMQAKQKSVFIPNIQMMGAMKNDPAVLELVQYLKKRNMNPHFSSEVDFLGDTSYWCANASKAGKMNIVGGDVIGVKTMAGKPILLEDLMEENYLDLAPSNCGILVPADDILRRTKYQWFAVVPSSEIFETNAVLAKYLKASIVNSSDAYVKSSVISTPVYI